VKRDRRWVYLTHPLGYDPYDSLDNSYLVNTDIWELEKLKDRIIAGCLETQRRRAAVLQAQPEPMVAPFNGDPLL
jgi:hypothetical protein